MLLQHGKGYFIVLTVFNLIEKKAFLSNFEC